MIPEKTLSGIAPEQLSEDEVFAMIIAAGVNASVASYNDKMVKIADAFCRQPINHVINVWDHLDDRVKVKIINYNIKDIKEWILSKK